MTCDVFSGTLNPTQSIGYAVGIMCWMGSTAEGRCHGNQFWD